MSAPQWKPGDVAMVVNAASENRVACFTGRWGDEGEEHWSFADGSTLSPQEVTVARPLVVIDPEDREQVERLVRALPENWNLDYQEHDFTEATGEVQAALRSLIAPPKPKVYSHIRADVSPGGISSSLCGKTWRAGEGDVEVAGRCPNCLDLIPEWVS